MLVTTFLYWSISNPTELTFAGSEPNQMFHIFYFQITENLDMSSSDDELPDIPGTRFPWMSLEGNGSHTDASNKAGKSNEEFK